MKVNLELGKFAGSERLLFTPSLKSLKYNQRLPANRAMIDTGSPYTLIMSDELSGRTRIPLSSLSKEGKAQVFGQSIRIRDLGDCIFRVRDKRKDQVEKIKHKVKVGFIEGETVAPVPLIVGLDFLKKHKLGFYWENSDPILTDET